MIIKTYIAGPIDANNYLIYDDINKEAVLVDCSDYLQDLIDFVREKRINVKYILLTHGHFDHILGVNRMKKMLGAKVLIHKNDLELVKNVAFQMQYFGMNSSDSEIEIDNTLDEISALSIGANEIKVFETFGHTRGSVSYLIENALFSGDTLFKGSVGRTDLPDGSFRDIIHSVKDILFSLDDSVKVYSGHGEFTTIGYEKKFNDIIKY